AAAGIEADRFELVAADLATWTSDAVFDLVTASFLHSWEAEFPREEILRRASGFVAPGGHLLIISHATPPPWASLEMHQHHDFPTPEAEVAALALNPDDWTVLVAETRERNAIGPNGVSADLLDGVVLVRRNG
ncbi:MAG: class I SAM-dependent methyltransferase, partial [Lacisediminihabitans sp.]